jgi:hypothetical protein
MELGNIQDVGNIDEGRLVLIRPNVRPAMAGYQHISKKCIAVPGAIRSQVSIPQSGEVAMFCDLPISIALETPDNWLGPDTEFRWKGQVHTVYVDPGPAHSVIYNMARLVIHYGRPDLGPFWTRPDPDKLIKQKHAHNLVAWAAGADTAASLPIVYPYGPPACPEAVYVYGLEWTRLGGNVEGVQIMENVTGGNTRILTWRTPTPSDRGSVMFAKPFRIACESIIYIYGSIEAVITPCSLHFIEAWA